MAATVVTHRSPPLELVWLPLSALGAFFVYSGYLTASACAGSANGVCVTRANPWPGIVLVLLGGFLIYAGVYMFWTGRRLRRG
jgi:hypothetical protein